MPSRTLVMYTLELKHSPMSLCSTVLQRAGVVARQVKRHPFCSFFSSIGCKLVWQGSTAMFGALRFDAHGIHRDIMKNLVVSKWRSTKGKVINNYVSRYWNWDATENIILLVDGTMTIHNTGKL